MFVNFPFVTTCCPSAMTHEIANAKQQISALKKGLTLNSLNPEVICRAMFCIAVVMNVSSARASSNEARGGVSRIMVLKTS